MHGLLFTSDFLREGIRDTRGWMAAETEFLAFRAAVARVFADPDNNATLNEAQTEDEIIVLVLAALGWTDLIPQANTSRAGRQAVPDFLLFASSEAKRAARAEGSDNRRYRHGKLILEAKRWGRPLDRGDNADPLDSGTPSSQMLRYLSRVQVVSEDAIQWGILTNGCVWRLYWQNARSRSEEFLEFDLAELAGVAAVNADLFARSDADKVHYLRAFFLLFRRAAFLPQPGDADGRSFHAIALDEGRQWESKVSRDLGERVFVALFPQLAAAIARNDPQAPRPLSREALDAVHHAALILLYRLLFVLYAEDRALLPVNDPRYDDYSLRWLRNDIAQRRQRGDAFSTSATRIWQHLRSLFRAIDHGDDSIGLPPYNGGLFHEEAGDLLARIELNDAELAPLIDGLSRRDDPVSGTGQALSGLGFINYRDLAVQHLGSIYERLLEQRLVEAADGALKVRPTTFARKNSGSYYTHDDLVKLILKEALDPLAAERSAAFEARLAELKRQRSRLPAEQLASRLAECDPAQALLALKVCDPAMGSGHFLVSLVDDLADRVLEQLAHAEAEAETAGIAHYRSPVSREIERLRERILRRATAGKWSIDPGLLDDRHLVRRMILKRVVHGVDKNPMAVELAKLALWLHTFTVGAPLSFLDHHLRCGDSLYGERLADVRADLNRLGALFNDSQAAGLLLAAETMSELNAINDVDLGEVERSRSLMDDAEGALEGLRRVFDLWQALRWIAPLDAPRSKRTDKHDAASELLSDRYGLTLLELLHGDGRVQSNNPQVDARVNALLDECRTLARRERFLHWELAFPSLWKLGRPGGFDAVIGNPPWDRIKLQEVEWFAERRPEIAMQARASDRKRMIAALRADDDPLADGYALAAQAAEDAARVARSCGDYPLLSSGDINLYSLFVERASTLVKPTGVVGLLTPSGIAADKGAAPFFRSIATGGRLAALLDFENRKKLFPDVDSRFKFCVLVFGGPARRFEAARCAFFLHAVAELAPPQLPDDADDTTRKLATRVIALGADDFAAVNPNTGTAPIFRNALDAELTTRIYRAHPVLVRHVWQDVRDTKTGITTAERLPDERLYPVRYLRMFDMTNDSDLFRTRAELEEDGWYQPQDGYGRWQKGTGAEQRDMLSLYEGKMVQAYDHRAAGISVNPENVHRPAQPFVTSEEQHADVTFVAPPQFFVDASLVREQSENHWQLAFKHVSSPTNMRSMIAAICPMAGFGNSIPLLTHERGKEQAPIYLLANLNSMALDYCLRQKLQGQNLNLFIVQQLPLIAPARYAEPLGTGTVGDFVRDQVLRLSYTAHDLAAFARDLGFDGAPFAWDAEDRRQRMARLDALYFNLYGLDRDEAAYVLDTFPIVREQDERAFGRYRTKELVLGYMAALAAGDTDTVLAA